MEKFTVARTAAWNFLLAAAPRFVPDAIDSATDDEAAFDCAMVLWAAAAEHGLGRVDPRRHAVADRAARVLSTHLGVLDDSSGREFRDPGFLALALIEYARALDDCGLLASGRKFVERAFGMKAPAPFAAEPAPLGGLFDFSSTTATRVLAVIAAEGETPFVGAWLRERIAAGVPRAFTPRRLDENSWNAASPGRSVAPTPSRPPRCFWRATPRSSTRLSAATATTTARSAATGRSGWPRRCRPSITRWRSTPW